MASTNTILIDCNQQDSIEAEAGNTTSNAIWNNKVSEGLVLNPGDRVSLSSAFINEVGSGEDTIQFTPQNNTATITLEFYKCADGENCLILPRKWAYTSLSSSDDQNTDEVHSRPSMIEPEISSSPYKALYRREQDASRYTLMHYNFITGGGEYSNSTGRPYYTRYTENVSLSLSEGYHTASNICQLLTEQLHRSTSPEKVGSYSIRTESKTFHTFPCASSSNFAPGKYHVLGTAQTDKWNAYKFVGMLDPELYLAGYTLSDTTILSHTGDDIELNWGYDSDKYQELKDVFDAQAKRSDLIFSSGTSVFQHTSTANTRFLHIDSNASQTRFGTDDDNKPTLSCTARVFVAYDSFTYGMKRSANNNIVLTLTADRIHGGIIHGSVVNRRIGFDTHFSAYGVDGLLLWNGYDKDFANDGSMQQIYLGALDPLITFDSDHSRFSISQLHTARKDINTKDAGGDPTKHSHPLNPAAGNSIYQINPKYQNDGVNVAFRDISFNPEVRLTKYKGSAPANNLLTLWTVFDSKCGVFVSSWGFDEQHWQGCLWNKLGYAYKDLNSSSIDRQARDGKSYPVTTNADVSAMQVMNWVVNRNGASQFTLQLPLFPNATMLSVITVDATSTELLASELARQQTEGYWLVRSSLIENSMFLDSRGLSPVIAVVDKSYSASDYIYLGDSSVDFMVTAQRTLTDITTSLHLPDGSYAAVNDRNAVIYRIVKPSNAPLSIIDSFLPGKKTAQ